MNLGGMSGVPIDQDRVSKAAAVIDTVHDHLHDGQVFFWGISANVNNGATKIYRFTTPNTLIRCHFTINAYSPGNCTWTFYEGPTINAAGTPRTPTNADRNSLLAATMALFEDATLLANGTQLWSGTTATANPLLNLGGQGRGDNEVILKQNTEYALTLLNSNGGAVVITPNPRWYEI